MDGAIRLHRHGVLLSLLLVAFSGGVARALRLGDERSGGLELDASWSFEEEAPVPRKRAKIPRATASSYHSSHLLQESEDDASRGIAKDAKRAQHRSRRTSSSDGAGPTEGGVSHCDRCQWSGATKGKDGCFYPSDAGDSDGFDAYYKQYSPGKVLAFNTSSLAGCKAQAEAFQRFDTKALGLNEKAWKETKCAEAIYKPSTQRAFQSGNAAASEEELKSIAAKCEETAKKYSTDKRNLVLILADTPRKDELFNWLKTTNARKVLACYDMSATQNTVSAVSAVYPNLEKRFIKQVQDLEAVTGAKGGDVQASSLIATGRVRAVFFFHSYFTECHRCDISSLVQVCNGVNAMSGGKTLCAYNPHQANAVMDILQMEAERRGCEHVQNIGQETAYEGTFYVKTSVDGVQTFSFVPNMHGRWKDSQPKLPITQNYFQGALEHCDKCQWTGKVEDKCYYPSSADYDLNYKGPNKTVGFKTSDPDACYEQGASRARFDGSPLDLGGEWSADCIKAFYGVSAAREWGTGAQTKAMASQEELSRVNEACRETAIEFIGQRRDLIVLQADTSKKQEFTAWLKSNPEYKLILECYHLTGSASMNADVSEEQPNLASHFVAHPKHLPVIAGPKGGDVQTGALIASHRVRAMIYFQSWQTECHRCDISSLVQLCRGHQSYNKGTTLCAFDKKEADALMKVLKNDVLKGSCQAAKALRKEGKDSKSSDSAETFAKEADKKPENGDEAKAGKEGKSNGKSQGKEEVKEQGKGAEEGKEHGKAAGNGATGSGETKNSKQPGKKQGKERGKDAVQAQGKEASKDDTDAAEPEAGKEPGKKPGKANVGDPAQGKEKKPGKKLGKVQGKAQGKDASDEEEPDKASESKVPGKKSGKAGGKAQGKEGKGQGQVPGKEAGKDREPDESEDSEDLSWKDDVPEPGDDVDGEDEEADGGLQKLKGKNKRPDKAAAERSQKDEKKKKTPDEAAPRKKKKIYRGQRKKEDREAPDDLDPRDPR
eukprot:TRINITY_DN7223_c0_g1_i1.p1 TRINITY_DN7223_c0_g1~~TRINITY_DN7223_c0_g1_i1.p1  ORF type:complete len:1000 (-),score=291.91 TRINITY_DN7223_c0_g1_i1:199-3198(-)